MELSHVTTEKFIENEETKQSGFIEPILFRPNYFNVKNIENTESSTTYSHESGDKYLYIQELKYKLKHMFKCYNLSIWSYFILAVVNVLIVVLGLIEISDFVALDKEIILILNVITLVIVVIGVIFAIIAKSTGKLGKNRIFIIASILAIFTMLLQILYELIFVNDPEERLHFKVRIFIQVTSILIDIYLIVKAIKIIQVYHEIKQKQNELETYSYFVSDAEDPEAVLP